MEREKADTMAEIIEDLNQRWESFEKKMKLKYPEIGESMDGRAGIEFRENDSQPNQE